MCLFGGHSFSTRCQENKINFTEATLNKITTKRQNNLKYSDLFIIAEAYTGIIYMLKKTYKTIVFTKTYTYLHNKYTHYKYINIKTYFTSQILRNKLFMSNILYLNPR